MTTKKIPTHQTRRLLLVTKDKKTLRLTVPKTARITFGAFQASTRGSYDPTDRTLRVYQGTSQIAVIPGISMFRDMDNVLMERASGDELSMAFPDLKVELS